MSDVFKIDTLTVKKNEGNPIVPTGGELKGKEIAFPHDLVPKGISYVTEKPEKKDVAKLVLAIGEKDGQVLIEGPKGTGKTTCIQWLAQETNNPLVMAQMTGGTEVGDLVGRWLINKEGTYWQEGILAEAMMYGYWLMLDEVNMALPEVLAIFQPVLDDRKVLVQIEKGGADPEKNVIVAHPNFRLFCAMNPMEDYAGTKEMNAAFLDRMDILETDYPDARKERDIILAHPSVAIDDTPVGAEKGMVTRMVEVARALRKLRREGKLTFECSTRNLIKWAAKCDVLSVKEAVIPSLVNKSDKDKTERKQIWDEIDKQFRNDEMWDADKAAKAKKAGAVSEEPTEDKSEDSEEEFVEMAKF